jgi:hypothetical protein
LDSDDAEVIQQFRQIHDQAYVHAVAAHWTLIFPGKARPNDQNTIGTIETSDLEAHIAEVARRHEQIPFTCRYAMLHADRLSDNCHLFLVPDEGFSAICRLHDDLYTGIMRPFLVLSLPYVPHIGIATSDDPDHLKDVGDEWNRQRRTISGVIEELWLASYDGKRVQNRVKFELQKS